MRHLLNTLFLAMTLLLCCQSSVFAQAETPKLAAGIRLGYPISVSVKASPGEGDNAIEAFIGYRNRRSSFYRNTTIGVLYQVHKPLDLGDIDGLQYYFGGGAGIIFWSYDRDILFRSDYSRTSIGILGNAGLNYTFEDSPVNISLDWMPRLFIGNVNTSSFGYGYGAVSARYVISR